MELGLIAIGIVLGLCAAAILRSGDARRLNALRDKLRAYEVKR